MGLVLPLRLLLAAGWQWVCLGWGCAGGRLRLAQRPLRFCVSIKRAYINRKGKKQLRSYAELKHLKWVFPLPSFSL